MDGRSIGINLWMTEVTVKSQCFLAALCVSVNSVLSPWARLRLLASEKTEA